MKLSIQKLFESIILENWREDDPATWSGEQWEIYAKELEQKDPKDWTERDDKIHMEISDKYGIINYGFFYYDEKDPSKRHKFNFGSAKSEKKIMSLFRKKQDYLRDNQDKLEKLLKNGYTHMEVKYFHPLNPDKPVTDQGTRSSIYAGNMSYKQDLRQLLAKKEEPVPQTPIKTTRSEIALYGVKSDGSRVKLDSHTVEKWGARMTVRSENEAKNKFQPIIDANRDRFEKLQIDGMDTVDGIETEQSKKWRRERRYPYDVE